ncbi:MAG TPA: glycosyltransferase [Rhizomicrobium sp.]|jgi:spore maturation protein CgeB
MAKLVILGLSITSSWGNGHATTYRGLVKALARRGHEILFLERETPWYAAHRDQARSPFARLALYRGLADLDRRFGESVADADAVIVGSFVPDGIEVCAWALERARGPVAFYDIDTPVTLASLERGDCAYLSRDLLARFDLYLSFTGGPVLDLLQDMGASRAAPLYCSVDPDTHFPIRVRREWELGYIGTYAADRQPALEETLFAAARRLPERQFVCAGPLYPEGIEWPENVLHIAHLPPAAHARFYCAQKFTLNLTRRDMLAFGYSPSVRLFEAAACGVPIISDAWAGLESFFTPDEEILLAGSAGEILDILERVSPRRRSAIAEAGRRRAIRSHTAAHRACELEQLLDLAASQAAGKSLQRRALVS